MVSIESVKTTDFSLIDRTTEESVLHYLLKIPNRSEKNEIERKNKNTRNGRGLAISDKDELGTSCSAALVWIKSGPKGRPVANAMFMTHQSTLIKSLTLAHVQLFVYRKTAECFAALRLHDR